VGATSNHGKGLKQKITGNSKIQQKQQIMEFGLDISISRLMRSPTAWYKMGRFAGNSEYKLAFLSQQVFPGTRTKLLSSPPKVDQKASSSNAKLPSPFLIDTLITTLSNH